MGSVQFSLSLAESDFFFNFFSFFIQKSLLKYILFVRKKIYNHFFTNISIRKKFSQSWRISANIFQMYVQVVFHVSIWYI